MLTDARFKFALESLKRLMTMEPKTSVFFSPHLVYYNLLVVYFGAKDDIENSLRRILHIPDSISKDEVQRYYSLEGFEQFCYSISRPEKYRFQIYGTILISKSKELSADTRRLFSCSHRVKEMAFDTRPDYARNFVNTTINNVTQRHVQNLLPANSIDSNTEVVVYNAIYCKGQFDINNRGNKKNDLVVQHVSKNKFSNNDKLEQLDAYIIEVPCREKKLSTFFVFPPCDLESDSNISTNNERIMKLLEQLTTEQGSQMLKKILDDGTKHVINRGLPTFKLEQDVKMDELLTMMGLPQLAPAVDAAQMCNLTKDELKLGNVVHRVNIDVTENNITATAANVFLTNNSFELEPLNVKHPVHVPGTCICIIYERTKKNIFFSGVLFSSE